MNPCVADLNSGTRKRQRRGRRVENERKKRYAVENPLLDNFRRPCNHDSKSYKCGKIFDDAVLRNRKLLYKNKSLQDQNQYLSHFTAPCQPSRRRPKYVPANKEKTKQFSCVYYVAKEKVAVCKKFFCSVFSIGIKRLRNLTKTLFEGNIPKENRGGDRLSAKYEAKRNNVKFFINKLPAKESHYARNKSKRIYLHCELNIVKLWKVYNEMAEPHLKVKQSFFRKVFLNDFNIGFSSPASDVCTYCLLMKNKIKIEQNQQRRQVLITEARIHKLRANAFYGLMKDQSENTLKFCFDLQQVSPLPRTQIQEAFYARQISLYNFCVVGVDSKTPTFYCWTENQAGRGSTEISSALINFLDSLEMLPSVETIELYCDGCGGQNKNKHVIHTLVYWMVKKSPVHLKTILLVFPVRGHSFLPADRVFGRLEKDVKKHAVLVNQEEYINIFAKHGKVKLLGRDWMLYNVKYLAELMRDVNGIQNMKRIYFQKKTTRSRPQCFIKTFETYRVEPGNEKPINLMKKGKQNSNVQLKNLKLGRAIKDVKKRDVEKLLVKQFGDDWKEREDLAWYITLLNDNVIEEADDDEDDDNQTEGNQCICMEHDTEALRL